MPMPNPVLANALWLSLTAFIWGVTNPFLKKSSQGICEIDQKNKFLRVILELKFLVTNWRYLFFFCLNQSGSVLYYLTLASADLSLAVPITNFLSLTFTGLVGALLGEEVFTKGSLFGMILVFIGVTICILSRV